MNTNIIHVPVWMNLYHDISIPYLSLTANILEFPVRVFWQVNLKKNLLNVLTLLLTFLQVCWRYWNYMSAGKGGEFLLFVSCFVTLELWDTAFLHTMFVAILNIHLIIINSYILGCCCPLIIHNAPVACPCIGSY